MTVFIIVIYSSRRKEEGALLEWKELLALVNIVIIDYPAVIGVQIIALGMKTFMSGF